MTSKDLTVKAILNELVKTNVITRGAASSTQNVGLAEIIPRLAGKLSDSKPDALADIIAKAKNWRILDADDLDSPEIEKSYVEDMPWVKLRDTVYLQNPLDNDCVNKLNHLTEYSYLGVLPPSVLQHSKFKGLREAAVAEIEINESDAEARIKSLVQEAYNQGHSDIHLTPKTTTRIDVESRVDGDMRQTSEYPASLHEIISRTIMANLCGVTYDQKRPQDGKFVMSFGRNQVECRVASIPCKIDAKSYSKITMRLLNDGVGLSSLSQLGISDENIKALEDVGRRPQGLMMVTGPTGSGKSTTLILLMKLIKRLFPERQVYTLEDPVEQQVEEFVQVEKSQTLSFAEGLRNLLRQDPDVILVGEIRDAETAKLAIEASNTGHFVLSTGHTNNGHLAITRLEELGVTPFDLAQSLVGVTAQRLVKRLCKHCAIKVSAHDERLAPFINGDVVEKIVGETVWMEESEGCDKCNNGFSGRLTVMELLLNDTALQAKIIAGQAAVSVRASQLSTGEFSDMWIDGLRHCAAGHTSISQLHAKLGPFAEEHEASAAHRGAVIGMENNSSLS